MCCETFSLVSHILVSIKRFQSFQSLHIACISPFCVPTGEIWGCHFRGFLLSKFGYCCRTLCQVQTAGGTVGKSGQELAVFSAGRRPGNQPQVSNPDALRNVYSRCWHCNLCVGKSLKPKFFCTFFFSFLSKLEERLESDIMSFTVCDIIAKHCQRFKMVYVPYLTNQSYQDATYQRLMWAP